VGFDVNRSTTDQIFCIRQILERKWEYTETVHQLFIDFSREGSFVRYSHRVYTHETSPVDYDGLNLSRKML
jgi:hypothetical protein